MLDIEVTCQSYPSIPETKITQHISSVPTDISWFYSVGLILAVGAFNICLRYMSACDPLVHSLLDKFFWVIFFLRLARERSVSKGLEFLALAYAPFTSFQHSWTTVMHEYWWCCFLHARFHHLPLMRVLFLTLAWVTYLPPLKGPQGCWSIQPRQCLLVVQMRQWHVKHGSWDTRKKGRIVSLRRPSVMPQGRRTLKVAQESKEDLLSAQTQIQSSCFQWSLMSVLVLCPPTRYLHSGSGCRSYRPVDIRLWNHVRLENMLFPYFLWSLARWKEASTPCLCWLRGWRWAWWACRLCMAETARFTSSQNWCCLIWAYRSCCVQLLVCFTGSVWTWWQEVSYACLIIHPSSPVQLGQ